jgi:hypothetical protein
MPELIRNNITVVCTGYRIKQMYRVRVLRNRTMYLLRTSFYYVYDCDVELLISVENMEMTNKVRWKESNTMVLK